jgi:P27 family predicted phage terminase small subunit
MTVKAPPHLSRRGRALFRALHTEFEIDDSAGLELLRRLCEASDVADAARTTVAAEGVTIKNRFGEVKAHPAVAIERDARAAVARLARELHITDPSDDPRPPRLS